MGTEWDNELVDFLQAGDLNPNGVVIGVGSKLPPPLDTYLIVGIAFQAAVTGGNDLGYYGIRYDAPNTRYLVEAGFVTTDGTILPMFHFVQVAVGTAGLVFDSTVISFKNNITEFYADPVNPSANGFMQLIMNNISPTGIVFDNLYLAMQNGARMYGGNFKSAPVAGTLSITGGGAFAVGNGVKAMTQQEVGARNYVEFEYTFGSTSNQGTGGWSFGGITASVAPTGISQSKSVGEWYYIRPASTARAYGPILMAPGASTFVCAIPSSTPVGFSQVGQNLPEAWVAGGILSGRLDYTII